MSFNVEEQYKKLNEGEVLFAYKGDVTSDLITNILEVVESKLEDSPEMGKVSKKIYNALVECLQNLYHHGMTDVTNTDKDAKKFGLFALTRVNGTYKITTGNFVPKDKVQYLKDRIEQLNSMSKDELKSLYKLILNNQEFSVKGGGGLGMIDVARKTGSVLNYEFVDVDDKFSLYKFNINIE